MNKNQLLRLMAKEGHSLMPPLFEQKDMYLCSCNDNGYPYPYLSLNEHQRTLLTINNLHLVQGLPVTEENGFPIMERFNGRFDYDFVAFDKRRQHKSPFTAIHFFCHDRIFENRLWLHAYSTSYELRNYGCLFAPDFSLYVDAPDAINRFNIYRSRLFGAYWQMKCGYNVIPVASMANAASVKYAFDGLPENSVIGMCGVGHNYQRGAKELWEFALRELEARKSPTSIIIYGPETKIKGITTPLFFIDDQISKHHNKNKTDGKKHFVA